MHRECIPSKRIFTRIPVRRIRMSMNILSKYTVLNTVSLSNVFVGRYPFWVSAFLFIDTLNYVYSSLTYFLYVTFAFDCDIALYPFYAHTEATDLSPAIPSVQTHISHRSYTDATLDAYYQIIIDANIFRPLGWRPAVKQPRYELIGTIISASPSAIILDKHSDRHFTLPLSKSIIILKEKQYYAKLSHKHLS